MTVLTQHYINTNIVIFTFLIVAPPQNLVLAPGVPIRINTVIVLKVEQSRMYYRQTDVVVNVSYGMLRQRTQIQIQDYKNRSYFFYIFIELLFT